tara:strand:+ start:814 stop:936 length:123 start_codon:yes stop_codon:yes gene_type:complete
MDARIAIIAMTTNNSISVKPAVALLWPYGALKDFNVGIFI